MQFFSNVCRLRIFVSLLFTLPLGLNGFSIANCTIKGSLKYAETLKVLCSKRKLRAVPQNIPYGARVFDISVNKITKIATKDLDHLVYLKYFNASNNWIRDVEYRAFRSLMGLQELNLANNKLANISDGFFHDLRNLTVLRLDNNFISTVATSSFSLLTNLIMVNLSGNLFQHIDSIQPLFTLPDIQELHIGTNKFSSFQSSEILNVPTKLTALDLSQNPLKVFNISSDVFPHLETLDLSFIKGSMEWNIQDKHYLRRVNRLNLSGVQMSAEDMADMLQSFNTSLVNLRLHSVGETRARSLIKSACLIPSLRVLRLQLNHIRSITEDELRFCTGVIRLDLACNKFNNLSNSQFRSMKNLTSLFLHRNHLTMVPSAIRDLTSLVFLDLRYNYITVLHSGDFANLTNLKSLYLINNEIFQINANALWGLTNLESLRLGANKILSLDGIFKESLPSLKYLRFEGNKLSTVRTAQFVKLPSLVELSLDDNQISSIENGAFNGLVKLTTLQLSSNKITERSITAQAFSGLSNLKVLALNNNYISYPRKEALIQPPFKPLTSLEELYFYSQGHKGMFNLPSNLLEGLISLELFWAGNLNINSVHPDTFIHNPNLWHLDLSKNEFTSFPPKLFQPIPKLKRLYMIKTGLQSLDFTLQANLTEISVLKVSRNGLTVINESVVKALPKLMYLDLQENAFTCDCSNAWFINWAKTNNDTEVIHADTFKCNYPTNLQGSKLMDLDTESCTIDMGFLCFTCTTSLVLLFQLSSFFYHFLKWQVVYAYYLFLAYLYDSKQKRTPNFHDFQYDAFISYNTDDELWVMKELLPQLEGEQGWRLCLHHRDFQPGKPIMENIIDGIYNSRKTICVISRRYLQSEWCSREVQVASFRLFDERKDVLILVFLEEIPAHQLSPYHRMRKLVKKRTYLSWPKSGEDTRVFWQKLRVALETKGSPDEESAILSGMQRREN